MLSSNHDIAVIGASSLVGDYLLPLLAARQMRVAAYARKPRLGLDSDFVHWRMLTEPYDDASDGRVPLWISLAPIWTLKEHFPLLQRRGVRKLLALSSTSRFSKEDSTDPRERIVAGKLAAAESDLIAWSESAGLATVILRPTLIYDGIRDGNISEIARFIRRFGFFPLLGAGTGLRQPIHARDVAMACVQAINSDKAANRAYNLSGGETLTYRDMVSRVFTSLGKPPRIITFPLWGFDIAIRTAQALGFYRHMNSAMACRMEVDLVFDHGEASKDFGFSPSGFSPNRD